MLKITKNPEFTTTVHVRTAHTSGSFPATFKAMPSSELAELEKKAAAAGRGTAGILPDVTVRFSDVELPGNTNPTLDQLLDQPGVGPAMVAAYYRGLWEEQQGNSERPSAGS